jgi:adenosylcobinamide kinase / adenosylcobinamide-phosphate guanylyltransferase
MRIHLVTGGARSGKSTYAEGLASRLGGDRVLYIATAEALDNEMQERIAAHRQRRPAGWKTIEAYRDAAVVIAEQAAPVVLLDCLTLLASNAYLTADDGSGSSAAVEAEINALLKAANQSDGDLIVVTNEIGMGVVPATPLGRGFRDALGWANQQIATAASTVTLLVSGIPMTIKSV